MPWQGVRGHDAQIAALRRIASLGRLPHAFLFVGPEGVGKFLFAREFARALLCERTTPVELEACGECPSCAS